MKRYLPLLMDIKNSKEVADYSEYARRAERDPLVNKIMIDAENLNRDVFGGCSRNGGCSRGLEGHEIRSRPTPEETKNMSRMERDKREIEGEHIPNDNIKDIAEDLEDIFEDLDKLMDPEYPLTRDGIKLDAAVRFSPKVQELAKMIMKDFGITSERDLETAMMKVADGLEGMVENDPYFQRARKAGERVLRYAMDHIEVTDLPTGKRMQWVNQLAGELVRIMNSDDSIQELHEFIEDSADELFDELMQYGQEVERIE